MGRVSVGKGGKGKGGVGRGVRVVWGEGFGEG